MQRIGIIITVFFFLWFSACIFLKEDARLVNQGYDSLISGNVGEAEQQFKAALVVNPENPYAMLNLGVIYSRTGREELARAMYRKVIANDASNSAIPVRVGEDDMTGETLKKIAETNLGRLN